MKYHRFQFMAFALLPALLLIAATAFADPLVIPPAARSQASAAMRAAMDAHRAEIAVAYMRKSQRTDFAGAKGLEDNNFDITDTRIFFDADETAGTIDVRARVTIKATADNVGELWFSWLPLDANAVADGDGDALDYVLDSYYGIATITLSSPLANSQEIEIDFITTGAPDCSPDSYFGMSFCAVGEDIVYFAGMDWAPAKTGDSYDDLFVTGGLSYEVTTPPGYTAASTADPAGVDNLGDHLVHHFDAHFSEYIGGGFAYAPYDAFASQSAGGVPTQALIQTGARDFGEHWAQTAGDIIDYYSGIYSPYLYNKQDLVQVSNALGGGYGPQSATFYYADALTTDPATLYSESIFSHEIGHAWWANMIRPSDQYSPWLSEGFAEYSSRLYGYQVWDPYYMDYYYGAYFRLFQTYVPPDVEVPLTGPGIFTDDSNVYFMTTYIKGAHVLRMLQWLLGDDAFFAGLSAYADAYTWDLTGASPTLDDFQASMEAASGQDLSGFFDQFVLSTGYPVYKWWAQFDEKEDGWTVRVKVLQTQDADAVYNIPIQFKVRAAGEDASREYRLEFDGRTAEGSFEIDGEPAGVSVDVESWIWGDKIPALTGDVDLSNEVDGLDLIYSAWSQGGDSTDENHYWNYLGDADFDRDGLTDAEDLNALLANFGKKGEIQ